MGKNGLLVSRVCLGTMTYGNEDWGCDRDTSVNITHEFLDGGGNFVDTADMYSQGKSEKYLGEAIKDRKRDEIAPNM